MGLSAIILPVYMLTQIQLPHVHKSLTALYCKKLLYIIFCLDLDNTVQLQFVLIFVIHLKLVDYFLTRAVSSMRSF